jgi:hypothetical protein
MRLGRSMPSETEQHKSGPLCVLGRRRRRSVRLRYASARQGRPRFEKVPKDLGWRPIPRLRLALGLSAWMGIVYQSKASVGEGADRNTRGRGCSPGHNMRRLRRGLGVVPHHLTKIGTRNIIWMWDLSERYFDDRFWKDCTTIARESRRVGCLLQSRSDLGGRVSGGLDCG